MANLNYVPTKTIIEKIMNHPRFDEMITGLDLAEFTGAVCQVSICPHCERT